MSGPANPRRLIEFFTLREREVVAGLVRSLTYRQPTRMCTDGVVDLPSRREVAIRDQQAMARVAGRLALAALRGAPSPQAARKPCE